MLKNNVSWGYNIIIDPSTVLILKENKRVILWKSFTITCTNLVCGQSLVEELRCMLGLLPFTCYILNSMF